MDLSAFEVSSTKAQNTLEGVGIHTNRNSIPFDKKSPFDPSGLRIGTAAITTRGFKEKECVLVAQMIVRVIKNLEDKKILKEISANVKKLCKKYPIYPKV